MTYIQKRVVLHFAGFEPLDAMAHRQRYQRTASQSAALWACDFNVGELQEQGSLKIVPVNASGPGWQTDSALVLFDHNDIITRLRADSLLMQILKGYAAFAGIIREGGLTGYFRHAWRFGLFFPFPFLLMAMGICLTAILAASPWLLHLSLWFLLASIPWAAAFFKKIFLPFSDRFHTLHMFANWRLALSIARKNDPLVNGWIEEQARVARQALEMPANEYLITSHSMGSNLCAQVIGRMLELEPSCLDGKAVTYATVGGCTLQCALLKSANHMRTNVGRIAANSSIQWFEIHCLTDIIHFYKTNVIAICGYPDLPQARLAFIRLRAMLTQERYRRIKWSFLRVHRQYVLGSDRRSPYDFTLLTAGPFPAINFVSYAAENLPPLSDQGAILR
jgi:hypothetical protein